MAAAVNIRLAWRPGDRTVSWRHPCQEVAKSHELPPRSAHYLEDPPSIVIVEALPDPPGSNSNAVVYEMDGTSRSGNEAVFLAYKIVLHGDPNLVDGTIRNVREWR
jgi:hypothetical protein